MIRYLNAKMYGTTETLDQLDSEDFSSFKEFKKEMTRLRGEYQMCMTTDAIYWSQRACK